MYRKFYEQLVEWEQKRIPTPLLVIGARQIGKTWIIRKFCEETYPNYIYINLEERADIASVFKGNLDPETILLQISQILGQRVDDTTPIFFDEIQSCERAITSLKYFCESDKSYRILCAGSLLGVKLKRFEGSFPVGKVRILKMYPMDFEEFLLACGEDLLRDGIREAYLRRMPLAEGVHEKALRLYQDYLYIGGMPQAVLSYLENGKLAVEVDSLIYEENPKFRYSEVKPKANKRDYFAPIDWLDASGMIYKVHRLEAPLSPLNGYENSDSFKVYLSDTGLLTHMCGLHYRDLLPDVHNIYKGAVTENYVMQQFASKNCALYYFKPSESMEIDLISDLNEQIIPIEIKSGRNKRSTSLRNYREKYQPDYAIRFSELNFGWQDQLFSIPLYAAWCI